MRHAIKAALISGLVFPGLGQIMLGEKKRGWLIFSVTLVCLIIIINEALQRAFLILEQIEQTNQLIDITTISQAAARASAFSDNVLLNSVLIIILFCWLAGCIDAYLTGKKKDVSSKQ